jgi:hypothetical protein
MNEPIDYQLANLKQRELKLRAQRHDIIVSDGEKALDKILDAPSPVTLVQSFPDQDLYYLMHKVGPDDFVPVLAMASSQQWEYILDVEVWDGDRFDLDTMTRVMDLLHQADPKRLLRWGIKNKPAFFEYFLSKQVTVYIREHDELPPSDFDDYITIDDKFYFRFPQKQPVGDDEMPVPTESRPAWELIEQMLKQVADMDLSVYHGLMLEMTSLLPVEVEEEEFRLKNIRLAEKGFTPTHEAIGIYQPLPLDRLRQRPEIFTGHQFDPDIPLPPQFFRSHIEGDDLFSSALQDVEPAFMLQLESELAALINKVISADKIKLRSRGDLEKAVEKARAYLNLGLMIITDNKKQTVPAHKALSQYYLEDIFRTASRACIKLKTQAENWFATSFMNAHHLPLSFLDETYLGVIGGLLLDRPLFFDNYLSGELYRDFAFISDIEQTRDALEQIIALDDILGQLSVDTATFESGLLTYKTLLLTLWAKSRLGLPATLDPITIKAFKPFFTALFHTSDDHDGQDEIRITDLKLWVSEAAGIEEDQLPEAFSLVLDMLIDQLDKEYGRVRPEDLDPRFIPHFLLKK